eukprot:359328-Chlamydomonas_euryale.AAC.13
MVATFLAAGSRGSRQQRSIHLLPRRHRCRHRYSTSPWRATTKSRESRARLPRAARSAAMAGPRMTARCAETRRKAAAAAAAGAAAAIAATGTVPGVQGLAVGISARIGALAAGA